MSCSNPVSPNNFKKPVPDKCLSISKTYRGYVVSVKEIKPNGSKDPAKLNLEAFHYLKKLADEGNSFFYDYKCVEPFSISVESVKKVDDKFLFGRIRFSYISSDLDGYDCDVFFESFLNRLEYRDFSPVDENIPFSYGTFALFALSSCLFAAFSKNN